MLHYINKVAHVRYRINIYLLYENMLFFAIQILTHMLFDESFLCKATLKEEKNSFIFWSLGGPKINESEDGKREVSNPHCC